uniref:Reverse transcriptase domain-containing protein n=1 Tax=Tanacetum cinerariifolium TaxID=118510 RepID=A0A6L2J5H8_TANCI|nr:reverse transcriptase domain-containing protein [Tanacetum cinerariifolium]
MTPEAVRAMIDQAMLRSSTNGDGRHSSGGDPQDPYNLKEYAGTLPLCNKCKFHHNGSCITKCANCKKVSHLTRDSWNPTATSNSKTISCYECGNQGHNKSDFLELKNRNYGNQAEGTRARRMVYALGGGGGETNQDLDDIKDDINA